MCNNHRKITPKINVAKKNEATIIPDFINNKNASEVIFDLIFNKSKYKNIYIKVKKNYFFPNYFLIF